ncbi:hypothetical protein DFH07DRAFT_121061 [Mycena maculata]|uniref:Uncharacterized protein n=1 Tax=Mycena maculata TaxID=230809 RepID=A0AAD7JY22_9AGAR|nr:hypothetical protein DFH07DRAFT_121061 [Mycena maculata]
MSFTVQSTVGSDIPAFQEVRPVPRSLEAKREARKTRLALSPTPEQWEQIEPTTLTVFHDPKNEVSCRVLRALDAARLQYPKPNKYTTVVGGPLKMELVVHERAPSAEEFRDILYMHESVSFGTFLGLEHRMRHTPTSARALVDLVAEHPELLQWPVVVDWEHAQSSLGSTGHIQLLKSVLRRRVAVVRPESLLEPAPKPERQPPPEEWIDYD